jgi:hypothetical protein
MLRCVPTGGIGLRVMATEAVSHLTPANTKEFFEDFFTRIALAAHRMRSRRTVDLASGELTLPRYRRPPLRRPSPHHPRIRPSHPPSSSPLPPPLSKTPPVPLPQRTRPPSTPPI